MTGWIMIFNKEEYDAYIKAYEGKSFNVKGVLRISWENSLTYDKRIFMVLFVDKSCEEAIKVSYANSFTKAQHWWAITSPYTVDYENHELAEALLGEEGFKRFKSSRFGCVRLGVEGVISNFDHSSFEVSTYGPNDSAELSPMDYDFSGIDELGFPLACLSDFKVIDVNTITIADGNDLGGIENTRSNIQDSQCYPLPGMFVQTMASDYYVNLRDKPSAKEGKVVARLVAQVSPEYESALSLNDDKTIEKARGLFFAGRSEFLKTNKMDVIASNAYTIFVSDILPGDWCRVTIYSYKRDENPEYPVMADDLNENKMCQTIGEKPSTVRLLQGYIHGSQLSELSVCTDFYYKGGVYGI